MKAPRLVVSMLPDAPAACPAAARRRAAAWAVQVPAASNKALLAIQGPHSAKATRSTPARGAKRHISETSAPSSASLLPVCVAAMAVRIQRRT